MTRLARDTGESAFFSARSGDETVCVLAEEGSFPLRSHVLHVGIRFPLGVDGSWGIGAAVFDRSGKPAWALSITGVETRFNAQRHPELDMLLLEHAHQLSGRIQA